MKKPRLYRVLYLTEAVLYALFAAMVVMSVREAGELRIFDMPFAGAGGVLAGFALLTLMFIMLTSPVLLSAVVLHIVYRRRTLRAHKDTILYNDKE